MNKKFYDNFHNKTKIQSKIINKNNFTYYWIIENLQPYISGKKLKIIDYGCGSGTLTYYLAKLGHDVTGVDISGKAIEVCRKSAKVLNISNRTKYYVVDNKQLNNKHFDLVICTEVIEHMSNDGVLIKYLSTLLNRDGIIFLSTPSNIAPLYKLGLLKRFDEKVGHLRRYSKDQLINLLVSNKFKIIRYVKVEGVIRNLLFTNSILGKLIKFIKGPLVKIVHKIDSYSINIFGGSNHLIIASKK